MDTIYKITKPDSTTKNNTSWGKHITRMADSSKPAKLCTEGVIHGYRSALRASLFNILFTGYSTGWPQLWVAEGVIVVEDCVKIGCRGMTTLYQVPFPLISVDEKVKIFKLLDEKTDKSQGNIAVALRQEVFATERYSDIEVTLAIAEIMPYTFLDTDIDEIIFEAIQKKQCEHVFGGSSVFPSLTIPPSLFTDHEDYEDRPCLRCGMPHRAHRNLWREILSPTTTS
jgi:hypothetical protein